MRYNHFVRARLDRSLSNDAWLEEFSSGGAQYLRFEGSDHRPLIAYLDDSRIKRKGILRFDNRLRDNTEIELLISAVWNNDEST